MAKKLVLIIILSTACNLVFAGDIWDFGDGYQDGYQRGYQYQEEGGIEPIAPIPPT